MQLLECCDESLRRNLHRSDKSISSKSETSILSAIKRLAVREENTMVSRVLLQSMHQDRDEGVRILLLDWTDKKTYMQICCWSWLWEWSKLYRTNGQKHLDPRFRKSKNTPRYPRAWKSRHSIGSSPKTSWGKRIRKTIGGLLAGCR